MDDQTEWKWYSVTEPALVSERLGEFISLMRLSRSDKHEFMTPERERFFHNITQRMAELNQLRLYFLDMNGVTVAESVPPYLLPLGCEEQRVFRRFPKHGFPFGFDVLKRCDWCVCHVLPAMHQG